MGLANLTTGGRAGQLAERAGVRFKDAKNVLTDLQSDEQKAADLEVQQADGFVPTVRAMVRNPSTIANAVAESAPSMITGGAAARGLLRAGALRGPIAAGAAGEGIVTAGQNAEQVRQETATGTLTPQQAAVLAASGLATGAISLAGGKLANRLGIGDVETMLASGKLGPVGPAAGAPKGALRRIGEGAVSEGLLQEAPQSYQEQVAQNVALGKPWDEGAASAAAAGMLVGGVTGAAGNVLAGSPQAPVQPPPTVAPTTPPAAPAAPPGTPAAPTDQVGANLTPSVGAIPNGEVLPLMPAAQAPEVDYSRPAVTRARAMGINPDRGPLSAAAAIAVNNGATDVVQRQQLEADAAEELKNTPKPAGAVRKSAEAPKKKAEPPPAPPIERTGGPLSAAVFSLPSTTGASDAPDPEAQQGPAAGQQPGAATDPAAAGGTGIPAAVAAGAAPDEAAAGAAAAQGPTDLTGGATNAQDQGQAGGQEAGTQPAASAPGAPEPGQPAAGPELLPQAQEQQQPDAPATIDLPAHATAATSPTNDIPQPTEAQKQAGNYPKGHVKLGGLDLSIENPEGSTRSGKDASGKPWETRLRDHYGYIRGTIGNDKDHVDTFVKPGTPLDYGGKVFVVDQVDPATGKFDEHKVMIGFDNPWQARLAYMRNYAKGWKGMQAITPMEWADFKTWVFDGPKNKALAPVPSKTGPAPTPEQPPAPPQVPNRSRIEPSKTIVIDANRHGVTDNQINVGRDADGKWAYGYTYWDRSLNEGKGEPVGFTSARFDSRDAALNAAIDEALKRIKNDALRAKWEKARPAAAPAPQPEPPTTPAPESKPRFKAGDTVLHNTARAGEPDRWVRTTVAKDPLIVNGQPVYWVDEPGQRGAQRPAPASHVAAVGEKPETAGDVKVDEKPPTAEEKKDAQWQKRDALRRSFEAMADEVRAKGHTLLADHLRYLSMRASDPSGGVSPHWHFLMRMRLPKLIEQAEKDPTYPFHEYIPPGSKTDLRKAEKARDEAAKKEANTTAARKAKQAEIFTALVSDPASVGQDEAAITQWVKDGLGLTELTDAQVQKLAASVVKEVAKRAAELEKQKHRIPAVREAAIAAAVTDKYKAADLTTEEHAAFIAGFDHALAGKTKSTLAGDHLDYRQSGYAAASKWIKTEEGAAWYEGRPVNKLENTGVDLRRWWEKLRENMKADESDIAKAWAQIERATARADLFAPLLAKPNMTPGHTLYITEFRSNVRPFKDWLQEQHDRWYGDSKSRWDDTDKSNIDYILEGGRYPYSLSEKDRQTWETDSAYRATWLRAAADEYLNEVRSLISFFDGTNTLKEAIDAFTAKFTDPEKSAKFLEKPSERGEAATTLKDEYRSIASNWRGGPFWLESINVFAKFRGHTPWTDKLLLDENAQSLLPTTAKPLTPPKLDRVTRDGADVRAGKDVTPADVKARFGLADVGFGKWVGAKQDQDHLNYAHDAFMDLAKFLGIKPEAIGLNGMHFTIGALGHGKFAAHFHPAQPHPDGGHVQVINVTNTRGDGTVAHEWFHALDHNLGGDWKNSVRPQFLAFLKRKALTVERVEAEARKFLVGGWFWPDNKKMPKPEAAIRALRQYSAGVVNDSATAYKSNADALGKDYWGNNEELIARASEAYVGDKLGFKNTYLVNPAWSGDGAVTKDKGYRGTPYPTGEERAFFNEIFDALIKSIKWEGGKPTVTRKDFEANLPGVIKAGETRRQALLDHAAMIELHESFLREQQERIDEIERERAEAERAKQAELDRLAQEKIDQMKPPKEPEAPPPAVVDGPNEPPAGALSDADLEHLFDQAAAELQEAQQETPDRPVPDEAPAATAAAWTQADLDEMMAAQDKAGAAGIATAEKIEGLPTIHELGAMGKTTFLGDGFFETTGYGPAPDVRTLGKPWRMTWSGGGAMRSTSSGKSYTLVQMSEGARPFTMSVQKAMEAVGSLKAPATTPQPVGDDGESDLVRRARERLEAGKPAPLDAGIVRTADNKRAEASATALIAEATKLGVKGASEALTGLAKLFGGSPGRLNSFGAGFDEETYQKAKPHFKEALAAFQAAGKTLKDLFKLLISQFGDGIKEYAIRFAKDEGLTAQLGAAPPKPQGVSVAAEVQRRLAAGQALTWQELFDLADKQFGGTQAEGKYTPKDAYDAVEAGVNRYLMDSGQFSPNATRERALEVVTQLQAMMALLPTQTKRTAEMDQYQQFSTVPPFAFVANWVANIQPGDVMMEPSAGIGGLAVFAKNAGAKLVLNELSSRRAEVLQSVFPEAKVFREDAEQIHNILPDSVKPTVVVMNPPFSSAAERGIKNTMVGAAHVEQALERLPEGGRLVAIVGEGMGLDRPAFKAWWAKMRDKHDVRAVVPVDGKGYAKYGTTFDNVLLVIDKVPSIGREPIVKPAANYGELIGLLAEVRDGRPAARTPVTDRPDAQPDRDQPPGDAGAGAGQGGDLAAGAGAGPATGVGAGEPGDRPGLGGSRSGRGGSGRGGRSPGNVQQPGAGKTGAGADAAASGAGDALDGGGPDSTTQAAPSGVTITGAATAPAAALTDSVFEGYQPQRLQVEGAKPHPGPLVQSAAMASVLPPAATYVPNLPSATVTQGKLSIAQIESVVYAGQAHNQWVEINVTPDQQKRYGLAEGGNVKYRRGFFIGDGTGVGKGREISGILLDNLRQGRKKAVWVSEKQGLLNDAKRDFGGVGGDADLLFNQNETTADGKVPSKNGIIFTTYSTLRSGTAAAKPATAAQLAEKYPPGSEITLLVTPRDPDDPPVEFRVKMDSIEKRANKMWVLRGPYDQRVHVPLDKVVSINGDTNWAMAKTKAGAAQSRIDQLVDWLGPDFDGVIAFDEAHNAGNATAIKTDRGMTDPSAQALAVVDLQMRLPKARVVYVSATGATEVSNLSFANRLGLWGPGTPFSGVEHFVAEMTSGGLATMELVARDMKQSGMYLARSLSYDGVTYSRADHTLTDIQREMYDRMADGWQVVLKNMMVALDLTGATKDGKSQKNNAKSAAKAAFWGGQQRFFNQVITSMQMPTVLDGMERDLQAGKAVVVQLVNTNEAQQERALDKRKEEGEEDLEDLDLTPMDQLIQLVTKSFPVQQYVTKKDSEGRTFSEPAVDSQGNPILNKAAVALRDKLLKDLEGIRDAVPDGPLEMLLNHFGPDVVAEVTGRKQRVVRKPDADGNVKATLESRGSSAARADAEAFMADRKRILVFSDAGGTGFSFQADLTKKNQRQRAHYLVQPGWRANKAVQGLGRTHRTNQASAPEYVLAATDIPAHKRFLSSIARRLDQLGALTKGQRDTSSGGLFSEKDNLESKYAVEGVKHLFADIERGQVEGINTDDFLAQMGLEDIKNPDTGQINESKVPGTAQFLNRLLSLRLSMQETVFNAFIVRMEEAVELAAKRGLLDTGMQTIRALETKVLSEEVVYVDERTGAETMLVDLEATQATRFYDPPDPVREGGKGFRWMVNVKSGRVWGVARSGMTTKRDGTTERRYRMMGTNGMSVRTESEFKPGAYKEISQEDALALWEKENAARPPTYTTRHNLIVGSMLPIWDRLKTNSTVQVKRTQTSDGRRLLGREIPAQEVAEIRKRLNLESAASKMTPAQVMEAVLRGESGVLANGWRLSRSLVSGDLRIELTRGRAWDAGLISELKGYGLIHERIQWQERMFVPVGETGVEAMGKLLKAKPLTDIMAPEGKKGEDDDGQFARGNPFYSALSREVERIPAKAQGGLGWVMNITGLVKAGKVKADEVEWSGLTDWLRMQQGKVTREQVLQYLATNGVQVTETTLGGDAQAEADFQEARDAVLRELEDLGYEPLWINEGTTLRGVLQVRSGREFDVTDSWEDADAQDAMERLDDILQTRDENLYVVNDERALPKYKQYQLPGGSNYREVLLTLPKLEMQKRWEELHAKKSRTPAEQAEFLSLASQHTSYGSPHWDQPNVLAHLRVNDRTDAEGRRVLFVEEIQSDWAQEGRKKGFRPPSAVSDIRVEKVGKWSPHDSDTLGPFKYRVTVDGQDRGFYRGFSEEDARASVLDNIDSVHDGKPPSAPFVDKTDAWVALALKRIIKMAVDEGYDRVAFVNGEQSAERYDLSKQVKAVRYTRDFETGKYEISFQPVNGDRFEGAGEFDADKLPDVVGKDLAKKIVEQAEAASKRVPDADVSGRIDGLDLKVGGEGMRAFYDQIVPSVLKDVLRKVGGGQLTQVAFDKGSQSGWYERSPSGANLGFTQDAATAQRWRAAGLNVVSESMSQPGFDITPAMRERAADGLPLFDRQQDMRAYRLLQALQRNPMDAQRVRNLVAPIAKKWDVEVRVVDTPADLPVKAPSDALGLHLNGVIYLVASTNRSPAQVHRTLAHEAVAHYGLRSMLGREGFRAFVNQVQFAARARPGPLREVSDYIRRTYVDQDGVFNLTPAQEGDEIAARVVELGVDPISGEFKPGFGMLKAVFSKIAEFLRKLGIPVRFTNAELQGMLVRSMRRLQAGRPLTAAMTAQASMSRAPGFYFDAKSSPLYKQRTAQAAGAISEAQAREALATDAVARRIMAKGIEVQEGDRVGARLNINVLKNTGVAVNTIHRGKAGDGYTKNRGWWGGEVIAYAPVVTLRDAYFNVDQKAREGIASGAAAKSPMASIDGAFRKEHSFDGVEFRFNPKREHLFRDALGRVLKRADEVTITGNSAFARGEIEYYGPEDVPARAGDAPTQGRLLEPGNDDGEAAFARIGSAQTLSDVTEKLREAVDPIGTVSLWDKTVGTQFNKATKDRDFKRVFDAYLQQTDDTAHYAIEAERNAPDILMRLDNVVDAAKALWHSGPKHKRDLEAVSRALFANIEGQTGVQSVRYDELSLRQIHNLNDRQIAMYYQARAAVDTSIERLAQTYAAQIGAANGLSIDELKNMALDDTVAMVKTHIQETHDGLRADEELRREVMAQDQDEALDRARQLGGFPAAPTVDETRMLLERLDKIEEKARFLQESGYMPAMRFGEYAVTVTDPETSETLHFEMFESQTAANLAAMRLRREYPDGMIEKSVMNPEQYRMFKGVSPETVELFAQFTGADQSEAYQRYIALAKSARNVKMRELKRKGIAGFSEDATRVLASFVTSNARQAAINMNVDEITAAMASKSLAAKGDVQREAQKLHEYMANPMEEARRLRGFMFLHFLGGSVASALVNLTQPMLQTAPYLSQFAGSRTGAIMARAARMAASGNYDNPALRAAAERAAAEGITEPHEVHQLMADASGSSFGSNLQARAAVKLWGSLFSNAESFNRRITFIAAYQVAMETGQSDPYAFARRAVYETQGIYSKVNRPNWARGGVGATLFTFKQFTISYLEWWRRLPKREKALAFAILVLFAGTEGLPFMDDIEDLIDTIGQTLGYNTNSKKAIRHAMVDTLGKTAGTMLNTGLLSMTGVDVSGRLGLGNLIPGTAMFKPSETDKTRTVSEFAGPLGGLMSQAQRAVAKVQQGNILGRTGALAEIAPSAVRNALQGLEMASTGVYRDTRGYKVSDVTVLESFGKMLGLQPESVASKTRRLSDEIQDKGMVTMMEAMIADRWAAGLAEKDPAKVQAARDALAAWNRNNPETPIRIKPMQITRRVREINRTREERFLRTAPKEMRGAAARELAS